MQSVRVLFIRTLAMLGTLLLFAAQGPAPAPAPAPTRSVQAHPALWTVHGPNGTMYLLGSIHVLPPELQWRTPQIDAALKAADIFVFEISMDATQRADIQAFVKQN